MLTPALIISLLVGTALGQRYKVLVLAPVFALLLLLAIVIALAHTQAIWRITGTTLAAALGLQVGYLLGISLRHVDLLVRAHRIRTVSTRHSEPSRRPATP